MKVLLYTVAAIYLIIAIRAVCSVLDIRISIKKLKKFISVYESKNPCKKELKAALRRYPYIKRYTKTAKLDHSLSEFSNKYNCEKLLPELYNAEDEKIREFWISMNPVHAVKVIFSFPAYVVSLFGVRQNDAAKFVVNSLFWVIEFIAGCFSDEIKALLISVLRF